jgi:hypothetical protein
MQAVHGKKEYNFFPLTFVLPADLKLLKKTWDDAGSKVKKWIMKPVSTVIHCLLVSLLHIACCMCSCFVSSLLQLEAMEFMLYTSGIKCQRSDRLLYRSKFVDNYESNKD